MRTLKKTLALVLVLAMMFSLCITASADFADQEDIQNELAVNVLTELGVINGMPDGTFAPEGTLTRAQAAKILCCLLGVDAFIEQCPTDFSDVAESHWASGYIAYCADEGIIDGLGDGTFAPSAPLTGYAWAKMLIVAFGMIPTNEEGEPLVSLTGSSWMVNTAKYATMYGIWEGDEDSSKKAELTRDFACLHAFNVIDEFLPLVPATIYDDLGNPVADVVVLDIVEDEEEEDPIVLSEEITAVATYTAPVTREKMLADMGKEEVDEAALTVVVDGVEKYTNVKFVESALEDTYPLSGNGVVINVYERDDAETEEVTEYLVVVANTYVATLDKADIVAADEEAETAAYVKLGAYTYETEEFAEGDIVLYNVNKAEGKVAAAAAAEYAEGKVTSVANDGSFKIDGAAAEFAACAITSTAKASSEAKNIYKDAYGYVVAIATIKGEVEEPVEPEELTYVYGYMTNYKASPYVPAEEGDYWTDKDAVEAVEAVEKIEIVTAAGEKTIFDGALEVVFDEETEEYIETVFAAGDYKGLVKYALNDEGKVADVVVVPEKVRENAFVQGNATMEGAKILLDAETLAFVVGEEIDVYTGYQNIPSFNKSVAGVHDGKTWEVLVVLEADLTEAAPEEPADPTESTVYVGDASYEVTVAQDKDGKDFDVYNYEFYVGTELVPYKALAALEVENGGLYTVSTNEDGYTTVKAAVEATEAEVTAVAATYFQAGSVYYTTDKTVYYTVADGVVAAAEGIIASSETETEITTVATEYVILKDGKVATVYYNITVEEIEE